MIYFEWFLRSCFHFQTTNQSYLNHVITLISLALINESYADVKHLIACSACRQIKKSSAGDFRHNRSFIL